MASDVLYKAVSLEVACGVAWPAVVVQTGLPGAETRSALLMPYLAPCTIAHLEALYYN